ncbi:MAG: SDR family NAD(P)-dependent oxidoreductase [Bacteroidota bacterium]
MDKFKDKVAVITGGTDGIGAATAIELCRLGAKVIILGRTQAKADIILDRAERLTGSMEVIVSDFSLMRNVQEAASILKEQVDRIDILIHAVGILLPRAEHTPEGIEKDFAVSYLSRFVFNEELHAQGLFSSETKMINIAASSPKIPKYAQMDFDDIEQVQARVGMKGHGQAQLANDLYTAISADRYGITTIGYGPGSVDTSIRREIPKIIQWVMKPFFKTRKPEEVASQFIDILSSDHHAPKEYYFYNQHGSFEASSFIADSKRQLDLLEVSTSLVENAIEKII